MTITFYIDIKLNIYDISTVILASNPYSKFITIARSFLLEGAI